MQDVAYRLKDIITAETPEQAAAFALEALVDVFRPQPEAACLLLWDDELDRYTVGDTWIRPSYNGDNAAEIRRRALQLGTPARRANSVDPRCLEPGVLYHPLNTAGQHTGALVFLGFDDLAALGDAYYEILVQVVSRVLHTAVRLQRADREHHELEDERLRLQRILQAVEQQQRTIDRLLAAERQFSASLEAKVQERTQALRLAQQRLLQSEKLAIIGKLASSLAHELNNPLQAIQSGLGLVLDDLDPATPDHIFEDLRTIQMEIERIESVFDQMLDFYRPVSFEYLPLDLNAICEGVRVLMRKHLQQENIVLELELAQTLPPTCGDSNQIKQVLLNLLLNAADAMAETGGRIILSTGHRQQQVCVSVEDDGPGIDPEYQDHLFEPLFTTKTRGLGLGLAISQEIVRRHDGAIEVESVPGEGTIFTVRLPVRSYCDGDDSSC